MIKSVKFKVDWRCFKAGDFFEFRPGVNLLVGDQGTGKSSIITLFDWAIHKNSEHDRIAEIRADRIELRLFDFERHNPRTRSYIKNVSDVAMQFQSHGSCVLAIFEVMQDESSIKAFILDEPDMALCIRSINRVITVLKATKHQVIAAVHNPMLIQAFPEVLSVEHRRWMPSEEFIRSHKV